MILCFNPLHSPILPIIERSFTLGEANVRVLQLSASFVLNRPLTDNQPRQQQEILNQTRIHSEQAPGCNRVVSEEGALPRPSPSPTPLQLRQGTTKAGRQTERGGEGGQQPIGLT